jgi:hypothetical protein
LNQHGNTDQQIATRYAPRHFTLEITEDFAAALTGQMM